MFLRRKLDVFKQSCDCKMQSVGGCRLHVGCLVLRGAVGQKSEIRCDDCFYVPTGVFSLGLCT